MDVRFCRCCQSHSSWLVAHFTSHFHSTRRLYCILVLPSLASNEFETRLTEGLARLLKDPSFLPEGGALGFCFDHKYRVSPTSTSATALGDIEKSLKGMDESISRVCESLSLKITIRAVYHGDDDDFDEWSDSDDRIANYPVVLNTVLPILGADGQLKARPTWYYISARFRVQRFCIILERKRMYHAAFGGKLHR